MEKMFAFWREAEGKVYRSDSSENKGTLLTDANGEPQKAPSAIFDFWRKLVDKNPVKSATPPPVKESTNTKKEIERTSQRKLSIIVKPQPSTTTPTKPQRNWKNDTKLIWMKPLSQLPVANDLPRLINCIIIEDTRSGTIINPGVNEGLSRNQHVLKLLTQLAELIDNEALEKLKDYPLHVKTEETDTGMLSLQLSKFLVIVGEDSTLVRILKACNQSIIAPTIIELKLVVCPTLPFKDFGGWKIKIQISSEKLSVIHTKRQTQINNKPEENFEFEWETQMNFKQDMGALEEITFNITDLKFGSETKQEKKEEISAIFKSYMQKSIIS